MIAERMQQHEENHLANRYRIYDASNAKYEEVQKNRIEIENGRVSKKEFMQQRQQEAVSKVQQKYQEFQAEIENKYGEIVDKHQTAAGVREEAAKKLAKEMKVRNAKERFAFEARYDKILKEEESSPKVSRRMGSTSLQEAGGSIGFQRSLSESQISCLAHHKEHEDLVKHNRERLRRSHHFEQTEQLNKLHFCREKVQIMEALKKETQRRRDMSRISIYTKGEELNRKVDTLKTAGLDKVVNLLMDMEPDQEVIGKIGEKLGKLGRQLPGATKDEDGK